MCTLSVTADDITNVSVKQPKCRWGHFSLSLLWLKAIESVFSLTFIFFFTSDSDNDTCSIYNNRVQKLEKLLIILLLLSLSVAQGTILHRRLYRLCKYQVLVIIMILSHPILHCSFHGNSAKYSHSTP